MSTETQSLAELHNVEARLGRTEAYLRGELAKATRMMARLADEIVKVGEMRENNARLLQQRIAKEAS